MNLVERLRDQVPILGGIAYEAADEIERLRAAIRQIHWHMGHKDIPEEHRDAVCKMCDEALREDE